MALPIPGPTRRSPGSPFHFRVRVLADPVAALGRREIPCSPGSHGPSRSQAPVCQSPDAPHGALKRLAPRAEARCPCSPSWSCAGNSAGTSIWSAVSRFKASLEDLAGTTGLTRWNAGMGDLLHKRGLVAVAHRPTAAHDGTLPDAEVGRRPVKSRIRSVSWWRPARELRAVRAPTSEAASTGAAPGGGRSAARHDQGRCPDMRPSSLGARTARTCGAIERRSG